MSSKYANIRTSLNEPLSSKSSPNSNDYSGHEMLCEDYESPHLQANHQHNHHQINQRSKHHFLALNNNAMPERNYQPLATPYKYDPKRGEWSNSADFYFACTTHAFGSILFSEAITYAAMFAGFYYFIAYYLAVVVCAIPLFVIQTFLGQFSSSGNISAMRVAPIFKGIGYAAILLNFFSLTNYIISAAVPMIYAANSLHSVIPWMSCSNVWNSKDCLANASSPAFDDEKSYDTIVHPASEFFRSFISSCYKDAKNWSFSWPLMCAMIGIWLFCLALLLKRISFIGKFFRFTYVLMVAFFIAIFGNMIIASDISWATLLEMFSIGEYHSLSMIHIGCRFSMVIATYMLGPGWGSVMTLASYNRFHSDSEHLTYWVSSTHVIMSLLAMLCGRVAFDHFEDNVTFMHVGMEENHHLQYIYVIFAYYFGSLKSLPNLWSFLFFAMLFLAELSAVIMQILNIQTAILDEFSNLRNSKNQITILLVTSLMICSMYFCTKLGFAQFDVAPHLTTLSYVLLYFATLLMATWIYGRIRFQCDVQFMLGKTISNAKLFFLRFVTPVFMIICIYALVELIVATSPHLTWLVYVSVTTGLATFVLYAIYKISQTHGSFRQRLQQCIKPHDWHPVLANLRSYYDEIMGTSEMLVFNREEDDAVV